MQQHKVIIFMVCSIGKISDKEVKSITSKNTYMELIINKKWFNDTRNI